MATIRSKPRKSKTNKGKIKVATLHCLHCGDKIWSRHRHDYRSCHCGKIAIDGGREYVRTKGNPLDFEFIHMFVTPE